MVRVKVRALQISIVKDSADIVSMAVAVTCRDAMAETIEELTPLKKKLDDFGTFLSKVTQSSSSHITLPTHGF